MAAARRWVTPRTADGQPDLQGIWNFRSATPLERPAEFAGQEFLSDENWPGLSSVRPSVFALRFLAIRSLTRLPGGSTPAPKSSTPDDRRSSSIRLMADFQP